MFKVEGKTIKITRGDRKTLILSIPVSDINGYIKYLDGENNVYWYDNTNEILFDSTYEEVEIDLKTLTLQKRSFEQGDKITMNVYEEERMEDQPVMSVEAHPIPGTSYANIIMTEQDTKIGDYINEKTKFWYEIVINDVDTIIGFDDNGPALFILYPEGADINA